MDSVRVEVHQDPGKPYHAPIAKLTLAGEAEFPHTPPGREPLLYLGRTPPYGFTALARHSNQGVSTGSRLIFEYC
jgi:hypothetical protein